MSQSRTRSLIEATINVVVGYVLAIAKQVAVFPLYGLEAALGEHLAIGAVFLMVSLARSYVLRRQLERIRATSHYGVHAEHGEPAPHRR